MRIFELKKEIELAIAKQENIINKLNGSDNPEILKVKEYNSNVKDALESVLKRINGDRIALQFF